MQTDDLVQQLIALPLPDRVMVAQALWQSIDDGLAADAADEQWEAVQTALRRDKELSSGSITGRSHEEVMEAVRQALQCG
jgi:hypothetical protein